jgi:protein-S-isoprenylcysteine O-methyltransferase Ste14
MSAWRHLLAVAVLPGSVTIVVPALLLGSGDSVHVGWDLPGALAVLPVVGGGALIAFGAALWYRTVTLFASIGRGTLAPWDPTRHLVVAGPYRYVRNPMITGVLAVLLGEAALFGAVPLLVWAAVFFAINALWFPIGEEPGLERRFGDEYREYASNVPRWVPRLRPWDGGGR